MVVGSVSSGGQLNSMVFSLSLAIFLPNSLLIFHRSILSRLGVDLLLEGNTELLAQGLELIEVLLVLSLVLDFGLDSCFGRETNVSSRELIGFHLNLVLFPGVLFGHSMLSLTFKDPDSRGEVVDSSCGF